MFLECAWQALEDAGYVSDTYAGNIGVFAGMNFNNYLLNNIYSNSELVQAMGVYQLSLSNAEAFLCTRTSYKLNLTGPSVAVQTACSTALVATAMAYLNLLNYQADMALGWWCDGLVVAKNRLFISRGRRCFSRRAYPHL
ncbi:MAG: hypothetical protein M5U34_10110 [Chloroflexi bacterium]|nr:hypothetical protein [Chloroflexota bacterium]